MPKYIQMSWFRSIGGWVPFVFLAFLLVWTPAKGQMQGVTTTGDTIIVQEDGTWMYKGQSAIQSSSSQPDLIQPLRPVDGEKKAGQEPVPVEATPIPRNFSDDRRQPEVNPSDGNFPVNPYPYEVPEIANYYKQDAQGRYRLWYRAEEWMPLNDTGGGNGPALTLAHLPSNGEALAMLTVVPQSVDLKALVDQTIGDAQQISSSARLVAQEMRLVNDRYLLCLRLDGSLQGRNFTYYSYYRAAPNYTLQLTIYAPREVFLQNQQTFLALLNGLVVP